MKVTRLLGLGAAILLAACSKPSADKPADSSAAAAKPPLVTVNGTPISNELYEAYVKAIAGKPASELSQEDRDQIKENLVRIELIAQQAEKDGLAREPEVATRLALSRITLLQQATAQKYFKDHTPTDAELRAEYETQMAARSQMEFQARHILLSSEEVAQKLIAQLQKGGDFAALARQWSADKESAKNGGELGWVTPERMVKPFADAVAQLKKGEITRTPVQTQFGWHVIQLENSRERDAPAFDAVKDQVAQVVVGKKFKAYSDEMLKTAKIDPPLAGTPAAGSPAGSSAATPPKN